MVEGECVEVTVCAGEACGREAVRCVVENADKGVFERGRIRKGIRFER